MKNVASRTSKEELEKYFSVYGKLIGISNQVQQPHIAFVTFRTAESVDYMLKTAKHNPHFLHGRALEVSVATKSKKKWRDYLEDKHTSNGYDYSHPDENSLENDKESKNRKEKRRKRKYENECDEKCDKKKKRKKSKHEVEDQIDAIEVFFSKLICFFLKFYGFWLKHPCSQKQKLQLRVFLNLKQRIF